MSDVTPGKDTSEYDTLVKVRNWVLAICGSLAAAIVAILGAGVIPAETQAYAWLTIVATVLGAIGGVSVPTAKYIAGRSAVKSEQLRTEAAKANPPQA